ncbi:DUF89 domain-containing protein [candidate division KSB1 bacterium]
MKTYFDCIPCFMRQALDSVRLVSDDEAVQERLIREFIRAISEVDFYESPPAMGQRFHRIIRKLTGENDPYREVKDRFMRLALEMYPELRSRVDLSDYPLERAVRLAVAGNVIDLAVNGQLDEAQVYEAIDHALTSPLDGDMKEFSAAISSAEEILYLADNAGEIVFDRLLIEQMPKEKITVVVRGFPVINDATMVEARLAGITEMVEVIDNGADVPGTIIHKCSEAFQRRFDKADLIIAKGQGNYETLSEVEKDIFFLLKAKCPVIAKDLDCQVGSLILRRSNQVTAAVVEA